jgi:hypothetical protein
MRSIAAGLIMFGLTTVPLGAQGRNGGGRAQAQGIPPGHLPSAGECRVWYDNRPPGHQPPPTSCREAERIASRDRDARIIYGGHREGRDGWWGRGDDVRSDRPRAIPRRNPSQYPYPNRDANMRGGYGYNTVPFNTGYNDGYDKGREDARDRDSYDPVRHSRYRSADHGYDRRDGSKEEYKQVYRAGFESGYEDGYQGTNGGRPDGRRGGNQRPWPF